MLSHRFRMEWQKTGFIVIPVFILALLIRCIYLNQIISTPLLQGLAVDSNQFDFLALQILDKNFAHENFIFMHALYPFFLASIYFIFGHSPIPVVFIQGILDSINCLLLYFIAYTIFDKKTGIFAAFLYAIYGLAIFYSGALLSTTIEIFLCLLFISSLLVGEKKNILLYFLFPGLFLVWPFWPDPIYCYFSFFSLFGFSNP